MKSGLVTSTYAHKEIYWTPTKYPPQKNTGIQFVVRYTPPSVQKHPTKQTLSSLVFKKANNAFKNSVD